MDFKEQLAEANRRLTDRRCRCRIEQRKNVLVLRATLPAKDGVSPVKQQRLSLGVPATPAGLSDAEFKAMQLDGELRQSSFRWDQWLGGEEAEQGLRVAVSRDEFVDAGRALHASKYRKKAKQDPRAKEKGAESWRKRWNVAFNKLPAGPITEKKLIVAIQKLEEGSASRKDTAMVWGMVSKQLGWNHDAIRAAGVGYGRQRLSPRDIPSDTEIEAAFDKLLEVSPHWARVWGMVATFGCRPSELGSATLSNEGILSIPDSKTGKPRSVTATKSAWVDRFKLRELPPPPGSPTGYAISTNANAARRRAGIRIRLYSLRHAAAIRLLKAGVPAELGAKLLGHSAVIFNETYLRWISEETIAAMMEKFNL